METLKKYLPQIPSFLFLLVIGMSAVMYILHTQEIMGIYATLGYPSWLVYFVLIAKIAGMLALLIPQVPQRIKNLARSGLFYIVLLAVVSHIMAGSVFFSGSATGLVLRLIATIVYDAPN